MKFFISLIFSLVLSFCFFSAVFAQETTDNDWGSIMNDYNNSADFGKIISNPEYKKALETKESFIKKSKQNKKKSGKTPDPQPEEKAVFEVPDSPYPLLILPVDAYYENKFIKQGFYLVNLKCDGGKYFLELRQGNNIPVAIIEAKSHTVPVNSILKPHVFLENVDDKMIKINYSKDNLILESVLWIN
jgi:hypothetical protein